MNTTRIELIQKEIESYNHEIQAISLSGDSFTKKTNDKRTTDFFLIVTDFVHYIVTTQETKYIFNSILNLTLTSFEKRTVKKANKLIKKFFENEIKNVTHQKKWDNFCKQENNQIWGNPNPTKIPHYINVKQLVELIKATIYNNNSIKIATDYFDRMFSNPNGVIPKYIDFDPHHTIQSINSEEYEKSIKNLEEIYEFNKHFNGYYSADLLINTYNSNHPNPKLYLDYRNISLLKLKRQIGYSIDNFVEIQKACKKICNLICHQLILSPTKEYIIDRYIQLCELYDKIELQKIGHDELELHKHFDKFAFMSGFFPLSEPKLDNGFADVIAVNTDQTILIETKYYDHNSKTKNIESRLQVSSYYKKLKTYPNISKNVYVLVFSDKIIEVDDYSYKDMNIIFKTINLSNKTPSELNKKDIFHLKPDNFVKL